MPKKATRVTPSPSARTYVDENLGIYEYDSDKHCTEERFQAAASLEEGISGAHRIDTTFENYSEDTVNAPRSDGPNTGSTHRHPAPHDVDKYNHPHRRY
jgi:hypothetical protein